MSESFIRPDGRKPGDLRDLKITVGVLDRADGSARVKLGKNLAIASVFGPRELHPKHASQANKAVVRINYRMATFSVTDYKRSFPSRREKEISKVLSEAFESVVLTKFYPRSAIDVHVQIFESDGGTRTAAAIATSAAMADAGIPMRDLTAGIASGLYEDHVCLDLNGKEDMKGTGDMPILYSPAIDEVSLFQLDGLFTFDEFQKAFTMSLEAIKNISEEIKNALKHKYLAVRDELISDEKEVEGYDVEEHMDDEGAETPVLVDSQSEEPISDETTSEPEAKIIEQQTDSEAELGDPVSTIPQVATVQSEAINAETDTDVGNDNVVKDNLWFAKSTSLKAMEPSEPKEIEEVKETFVHNPEEARAIEKSEPESDEEKDDVLRDIEYSELEEEEE